MKKCKEAKKIQAEILITYKYLEPIGNEILINYGIYILKDRIFFYIQFAIITIIIIIII